MADTRATVSLSPQAGAVAGQIKDTYGFGDIMDVVRFGAAVALAHHVDPAGGRNPGPATGTWNLGSLDRDGELRELVRALYPEVDQDPAIVLEALMDRGLILLGELVSAGDEGTLLSLVERARATVSS
jgi:hypothetical protein